MADGQGKLELNWAQAVGSGLAALSSAVLLSTVGATGTVIGAAVGAVVITVGSAFYSHYLAVSKARMAAARDAAGRRAARAMRRARSQSAANPAVAGQRIAEAQREQQEAEGRAEPRVRWQEVARGLRWKPLLLASAAVFVLVMGTILSLELTTGRALSSYTGGTTADGPRTSIPLPGLDRDEQPSELPSRGSGNEGGAVTTDARQDPDPAHGLTTRRPAGAVTGVAPTGHRADLTDIGGADPSTETTSEPAPEPAREPAEEITEPEPEPEPAPEPAVQEPVEPSAPAQASPAAPAATPQPSP